MSPDKVGGGGGGGGRGGRGLYSVLRLIDDIEYMYIYTSDWLSILQSPLISLVLRTFRRRCLCTFCLLCI